MTKTKFEAMDILNKDDITLPWDSVDERSLANRTGSCATTGTVVEVDHPRGAADLHVGNPIETIGQPVGGDPTRCSAKRTRRSASSGPWLQRSSGGGDTQFRRARSAAARWLRSKRSYFQVMQRPPVLLGGLFVAFRLTSNTKLYTANALLIFVARRPHVHARCTTASGATNRTTSYGLKEASVQA